MRHVVGGDMSAVNPRQVGTKAAAHYRFTGSRPGQRDGSSCRAAPSSARASCGGFERVRRAHAARRQRRGRRVLRRAAGRHHRSRRAARAAPGVGRHDLDQAVLPLRRARSGWTAIPAQPPPPPERKQRPQHDWDAPEQCRRHLDAGQVGVPVVRGLGPGVPLHSAGARRCRVRQGAARAADARVVHAPQRPAAGLRMGLRRRESAGACLGDLARVPDRSQAARRRRRHRSSSNASSTS